MNFCANSARLPRKLDHVLLWILSKDSRMLQYRPAKAKIQMLTAICSIVICEVDSLKWSQFESSLLTVELLLIGWWCWCCLGCSGICCLSIVVLILMDLLCSAGDACCSGIPFGKEPVSARSKSNKFPLRPKMSRSNRIKSSWRTTSRISVKNEA